MNEIIINGKDWLILLPIFLTIPFIFLYRYCGRVELKRIERYVANLQGEDTYMVAESLIEISKAELNAEGCIVNIITLLGDQRVIPEQIKQHPEYNRTIHMLSCIKDMKDIYIGNLAAAVLIYIYSIANSGLLYYENDKQFKVQRSISKALVKIFNNGTSEQKMDAIHVINTICIEENIPVIAGLLKDEDPDVRVSALGLYISYAPFFDISLDLYNVETISKHDKDETVRSMAGKVLANVNKLKYNRLKY